MLSFFKNLFKRRVSQDHADVQSMLLEAHTRLQSPETLKAYNHMQEVIKAVELLKQAQQLTGDKVLTLEAGNIERSFKLKDCGKLRITDHNEED